MTNNTDKQNMLNKLIFNEYVLLNPSALKEVLDAGANPSIYSTSQDATPLKLLLASLYHGDNNENEESMYPANVDVVLESTKTLIEAGASVDELKSQDHYNYALSNIFARSTTVNPLIEYLVGQGVDFVNLSRRCSALGEASTPALVKFLLDLGADPNGKVDSSGDVIASRNYQPCPPIIDAARSSRHEDEKIEIIQLLLDAGADINFENEEKEFVLTNCIYTEPKVLHFLLDKGADPSRENYHGENALNLLLIRINQTGKEDKEYAELLKIKDRMLEIMGLDLKL